MYAPKALVALTVVFATVAPALAGSSYSSHFAREDHSLEDPHRDTADASGALALLLKSLKREDFGELFAREATHGHPGGLKPHPKGHGPKPHHKGHGRKAHHKGQHKPKGHRKPKPHHQSKGHHKSKGHRKPHPKGHHVAKPKAEPAAKHHARDLLERQEAPDAGMLLKRIADELIARNSVSEAILQAVKANTVNSRSYDELD